MAQLKDLLVVGPARFLSKIKGNLQGNADTATKLETPREISINLSSNTPATFDGSDDIIIGVDSTLPVARGGTGITSNPSLLVNLASTTADTVFEASPRPGVTGALPVANGGTGATTAANALKNLGLTATAAELNYVDGVTSSIQTQIDNLKSYVDTEDAKKLNISGGKMTGPISFDGNASLPSKTLQYVTGIDAFAEGGQMGWQSKTDFLSDCAKLSIANTYSGNAIFKKGSTQAATPSIKWEAFKSKTPFIGYCTSSTDDTFMVGSLDGTSYTTGLAIGGSSGNLLWKGNRVLDNLDLTTINNSIGTKQATITGAATTITGSNLTANRALISNGSGKVAVSAVTSTELGYLDGVTSAIQTQLDGKMTSSPVSIELNSTGGLSGYGGFIDFHYNGSTADYTSRIIEDASGELNFTGGSKTKFNNQAWFYKNPVIEKTTTIADNEPARLTLQTVQTNNGTTTSSTISVYDDHDTGGHGNNMVIKAGGNMILGGGESAENYYNTNLKDSTSEHTYITADGTVYLVPNCNTIANAKIVTVNTDGTITTTGANRSAAHVRNSEVRTSSTTGTLQSTGKIIYVRE